VLRRPRLVRRRVPALAGVAGLVLVGLVVYFAAGGRPHASDGGARRPNVLILADDSLRPDHMGAHGYPRDTTPNLDAFAAQAVDFTDAYVPVARTFPSWATILTGRWPHEHGIRHMFPLPEHRLQGQPTLPRLFAAAGYRTAVVADYAGDIFSRLDAGFETVQAPRFNVDALIWQRCLQLQPSLLPYLQNPLGRALFPDLRGLVEYPRTERTMDELMDVIDDDDGRPFFVVAFFSSSHFPFAAPDPFYRQFTAPDYEGSSVYMRFRSPYESTQALAAESEHLQDLFDGTLRYFDHHAGRLFRHLAESGRADDTVVVVTADHGELLGEYGTIGHGDHLRGREAHRVPLLVRAPGLVPRRVEALVRSVDLAPTLANLAGVPATAGFSGVDLGPLLRGERDDLGLLAFGETGLWFTSEGEEFFFRQRLPYPLLTETAEVRFDGDKEICLRPSFQDLVTVAKHRAAWNRDRKVIYVPTEDGIVYEAWRRTETGEEVPDSAPPDPALQSALLDFLRADGRAFVAGGYALPVQPVAAP